MLASPDSEDVFQQTICQALGKFQQFRGDSSFLTWLSSIALNEVRQFMRKRRRLASLSLDEEQLETSCRNETFVSSLDLLCRREEQENVRRAIELLPRTFRTAIELRDFNGLSLQDTAKLLNLSLPAAKSRYFRARKHLVRKIAICSSVRSHMPRREIDGRFALEDNNPDQKTACETVAAGIT
jgi:RNA polymerase sigma-70 factor (ECF subfamily)